jgi:cell division transport system permease protein
MDTNKISSVLQVKAKTASAASTQILLQSKASTLKDYATLHQNALRIAIERLFQTPLTTLLTILVIGIALALPGLLYFILENVKVASAGLNTGTQITLYLKTGIQENTAQQLISRIKANHQVAQARYISPENGLNEFAKQTGFQDVLNELPQNPLPGVIVVRPKESIENPNNYETLESQLKNIPEVSFMRMDMAWVKRLFGLIKLAERAIFVFSLMLGFAVILIIGNTLRLMVQNHHEEIEVIRIIGGTQRYILRPFLYAGALCGLLGSIVTLFLIELFLLAIRKPISELSTLYQTHFLLNGLSFGIVGLVLLIGTLLGILSTQISVRKHLLMIQPR